MGSNGHLANQLKDMPFRRIATHSPYDQLARVQRASPRLQHMGHRGGLSGLPHSGQQPRRNAAVVRSTCFRVGT